MVEVANKKRKNRNRSPRVEGTLTSIQTVSLFTVDEDKEVRLSPNTRFSGVAVGPTGLIVGQQIKAVGHRNRHKDFVADKVNVGAATGPAPDEPVDPEDEDDPLEPTPPQEPEPQPTPPAPDDSDQEEPPAPPADEEEEEEPAEEPAEDENASEENNA